MKKDAKWSGHVLIIGISPAILMEWLRRIRTNFSSGCHFAGPDSNFGSPEYKMEVLTLDHDSCFTCVMWLCTEVEWDQHKTLCHSVYSAIKLW